ncbi:Scr1 family TA system antitoxin-like transcriptional regulator [Streptomyces phaeochromogenes]|uniref:Scr1 family TA system antitoxin-like transcriptional regulator n=1 Tax=Streptomyces phaeochromogenes TaxID=1923 RepID=UPI00371DCB77
MRVRPRCVRRRSGCRCDGVRDRRRGSRRGRWRGFSGSWSKCLRAVEIQVVPSDRETHSGLNGPMILLETEARRQLAYVEGQDGGYFVSEQPSLGDLFGRYGILRAQALAPEESAKLIEQVAHEL